MWLVAASTAIVAGFPYHYEAQSELAIRADARANPFYEKG